MVECAYCKKETGKKLCKGCKRSYCDRTCMTKWRQENGTWNKGKKWKEIYSDETLLQLRIRNLPGKQHHNYGRERPDMLVKNLIYNNSYSEEKAKQIQEEYAKDPEGTLKRLKENSAVWKPHYQRKAFKKYGRRCQTCGRLDGQIDVHHLDGNHKNQDINNLQVLCASCHGKNHGRPKGT